MVFLCVTDWLRGKKPKVRASNKKSSFGMQQQGWGGNKTAAAKRMIFQFPKVQTTKKANYNSILLKAIYEHKTFIYFFTAGPLP